MDQMIPHYNGMEPFQSNFFLKLVSLSFDLVSSETNLMIR